MPISFSCGGFPRIPIASGGGGGGGGGGGSAPVILFADFRAGPITGGENNKGCYVTLYGLNLGNFSDYGSTNHITIGGVEVDNYRCMFNMMGAGSGGPGQGVYETWGAKGITFQVGTLGSPTLGSALKIDLTVGGVHPSNPTDGSGNYKDFAVKMDGSANSLTFTPNPGAIIFVDRTSGNNGNSGTIASPLKDLQISSGFGGAFLCATGAGQTNGVKPGTHIIDLGGSTNTAGLGGFAAFLFRISGTLETGSTNSGPICYTRYPGAAGTNSPALVTLNPQIDGSGNGGGGFNGNDQARAGETNPYDGLPGWSRSIHISNVTIVSSANGARDGCPINLESSGDDWRVVNCDLSWPWVSNATNVTNAAGIAGNGKNVFYLGNWIHNIQGVVADNQNHMIYIDGSVACANGVVVFLNCGNTMTAGNGIQTFNSQAPDTIQNISVHNNWVESAHKHGLNVSDNTRSRIDFNNVVVASGEAAYNVSTGAVLVAGGLKAWNNTFYGWARVVTSRACWWNQGVVGSSPASTDTRNNIFCQLNGYPGTYSWVSTSGGTDSFAANQWYDVNGIAGSKPSNDATGATGDPQFTNAALKDFTLQATSPCIDTATTPLLTTSYDFLLHTITGALDRGAYQRGATYP